VTQSRSYAFGTQAAVIHSDGIHDRIAHELETLIPLASAASGSENASRELAERLTTLVTKLKAGKA
jgi:hypothetical protein